MNAPWSIDESGASPKRYEPPSHSHGRLRRRPRPRRAAPRRPRALAFQESCASPRPEARAARFGESTICHLGERDDRPRDDDRGYANGGGYEDRGGGGGGGKSRGTALRWNERGFGFIKPDDGGDDLFCHVSQITDGNALSEGATVHFVKVFDERRGSYPVTCRS